MSIWKSTGMIAFLATAMSLASLGSMAHAQVPGGPPAGDNTKQGPPPREGQDGPPPPMRDGQDGPQGRDGEHGPGGPGGQGGPMGQRGQGGPQGPQSAAPGAGGDIGRFGGYITMVGQYSKLAADPEASGVAAVISAGDVLRRKGPQAGIEYFTKLLPEVKMEAVKRAIRLQLIDLYKVNKQDDKALEELKSLMTAEGPEFSSTKK